jgi:hypothetical protein
VTSACERLTRISTTLTQFGEAVDAAAKGVDHPCRSRYNEGPEAGRKQWKKPKSA